MKAIQYIKPFITTFLLLALVAAMGVVGASYASRKSRDIAEQTLPSLSHLALGNQYRGQAFLYLIRALNATTNGEFERQKADIDKFSNRSHDELELYEDTIASADNRALYMDVMAERESYLNLRDEILALAKTGNREQANQLLAGRLLPIYERYLDRGQRLVDYASKKGVERADAIRLISLWSQIFAIISSILIFVFGFFLGFTR